MNKQCVRLNSGNLNSHSGNLNTDSGKSKKVFSLKPESVFKLNQNRCSAWIRMGVQVGPEYAEAGYGKTNTNTVSGSATVSYGFKLTDNWMTSPYAGIRHTSVYSSGYTEQQTATVTTPLSYSALNQESTTALLGVKLYGQIYDRTYLQASAGYEQDISNVNSNYNATGINGLTPISFNPNIQRSRAVTSATLSYSLPNRHTISLSGVYRQESFQSVDTKMAYINYSIGF